MTNLPIVWRPAVDSVYVWEALAFMGQLETGSVNCIVTSPPYFGLRDYGTASWEGGDPVCQHRVGNQVQDTKAPGAIQSGMRPGADASTCKLCGAKRIDQQIGLEASPQAFVDSLVRVFREARRVLRDDGTCWINLGDSYARTAGNDATKKTDSGLRTGRTGKSAQLFKNGINRPPEGLKSKDLIGIPWRVAFALQSDGWYLRSDIIWHKPNPMPESVTDRPTKSHEYLFLMTKSEKYWYDADAIAEPANYPPGSGWDSVAQGGFDDKGPIPGSGQRSFRAIRLMRNRRTVWTVATQPYSEAHFATFPPALIEPCILAGCPKDGLVLDPFMGAGTTALVAKQHGRHYIGCDLNPAYVEMATLRVEGTGIDRLNAKEAAPITDLPMFASIEESA
jgi:DNA modification methylase